MMFIYKISINKLSQNECYGAVMAAEEAFETSAQSTGRTILLELAPSLVTFRSTAYVDKVSQSVSHQASQRWLSGESPHRGPAPQ